MVSSLMSALQYIASSETRAIINHKRSILPKLCKFPRKTDRLSLPIHHNQLSLHPYSKSVKQSVEVNVVSEWDLILMKLRKSSAKQISLKLEVHFQSKQKSPKPELHFQFFYPPHFPFPPIHFCLYAKRCCKIFGI